jgi:hypothetical protein
LPLARGVSKNFNMRKLFLYFQFIVLFTNCSSFHNTDLKRSLASPVEVTNTVEGINTFEDNLSVILVCLDGVGYNLLEKIDSQFVDTQKVKVLKPSFPSNSFPSQMSIVTGVPPEVHGIADNHFQIPLQDFLEVKMPVRNQFLLTEPLWSEISKKEMDVYTMAYMQSVDPWPVDSKLSLEDKHISIPMDKSDSLELKLDKVIELETTNINKKQLFVIWDYGLDHQAHGGFKLDDGDDSDLVKIKAKWETLKTSILKFYSQLKLLNNKHTKVIFVSDHGMDYVDQKINIPNLLNAVGLKEIKYSHSSGIIHLYNLNSDSELNTISNYLKIKNIEIKWHYDSEVSSASKTRMGVVGELQAHTMFDNKTLEDKSIIVLPMKKILGNHGWDADKNNNMNGILWRFSSSQSDATEVRPPMSPPQSVLGVKDYVKRILNL